MRIVIETQGDSNDTKVSINDRQQKLTEFQLSVRSGKKIKIQLCRDNNGKPEFVSYYGDDVKKYDEYQPERA